jgi:MFS family permease
MQTVTSPSPPAETVSSTKIPSFILPILIAMLISFSRISTYRIIINFGNVYIVDIFGLDPLVASSFLTVSLVMGAGVNLIGGYMVDRFGFRASIMLSNFLAVPTILWLALTSDVIQALVSLVLFSSVFFLGSAAESSYLQEITPLKNQGTIFAVVFSMETGVATFTLIFFGIIAEFFGLRTSMLMTTGITMLGIVAAFFITRTTSKQETVKSVNARLN